MKVRKKPIVADAWLIADLLFLASRGAGTLPKEVREAYEAGEIEFESDRITIATLEGVMTGWGEWYLIRGTAGEWYPCEPDVFDQVYEPVYDIEGVGRFYQIPIPPVDPYEHSPEF